MTGRNAVLAELMQEMREALDQVLGWRNAGEPFDDEAFDGRFAGMYQRLEEEIPGRDLANVKNGDPDIVRIQLIGLKDLSNLLTEVVFRPEELMVLPDS